MSQFKIIPTVFQGGLLGIANIIPGVSGGTMALVLGIYQRLIKALQNIDLQLAKAFWGLVRGKPDGLKLLKQELQRVDFWFVVTLGIGAVAAILATSRLIVYLLNHHHDPTYDDKKIDAIYSDCMQIISERNSTMACYIAREGLIVEL